jgi:outer membrane protein TolC
MSLFLFRGRFPAGPSLAALALLLGAGPLARSQDIFPLARDPVVRGLVEEALERNPDIKASRERTLAAMASIDRAAALSDPVVSVGYEKGDAWLPGGGADTGPRVAVSQELPYAGKRALRRDLSTREAELTRHEGGSVTLGVIYAMRKAVADLLLARENIAIIRDQRSATADIEELTRTRYAAGLAGQLDVLRAQAEVARFDQMRTHEEGLVASAIAEINRLRGQPGGTQVDLDLRLTDLMARPLDVPELAPLLTRAHGETPGVRAATTMVERDRLAVEIARRNLKPDFVVSSAYAFRGSLPDRFMLEVGLILPAYHKSKQRLAIAQAEAELRSSQASQEAMVLRARSAVEKAYADYRAAVLEARTIEHEVLVIDALAVESALAGFRSGQTPFISVLEAHRVLYEDRRQHAELLFHILWHSALLDAFGMERQSL